MASGNVGWDIDVMQTSIKKLTSEKDNLLAQRDHMMTQKNRVDVSWKSPAGQQYQNRLATDIMKLNQILDQLNSRLAALKKVVTLYKSCEDSVSAATKRLPG